MDRLLPFNTSKLEQAIEHVHAQRLASIPLPLSLWNPETCPEHLLPWLAWALSVETWDSEWAVEIKRAVIATSIVTHRQKGTLSSVRRVLDAIRVRFELEEWFEYEGEPYTFRLTASANEQWEQGLPAADSEVFNRLRDVVDSVKPVRSHYRTLVKIDTQSDIALGNASSVLTVLRHQFVLQFIPQMHVALAVSITMASPYAVARYRVEVVLPPLGDDLGLSSIAQLKVITVLHKRFHFHCIRPESVLRSSLMLTPTLALSVLAVL